MAYDFSRLSILIVDDDDFIRRLLRDFLCAVGVKNARIREASDGQMALGQLQTAVPDLVICDLNMRPMDGKTFIRNVRTSDNRRLQYLPILVCTAHAEFKHIADARDAGASEILLKPFDARSIYGRMQSIFENPRPFVHSPSYNGPDRRRKDVPFDGPDRRKQDIEI